MSDVQDIQAKVSALGDRAEQMAGNLDRFGPQFDDQVREVTQRIEGTSTGADQAIINTLRQASDAVKSAASALKQASTMAKEYRRHI